MIEMKKFFDDVKEKKEKILLWVVNEEKQPIAMRTCIKEVFLYDGKLAGLGCSPEPDTDYIEYVPMDEVLKFSIIPDDMMERYYKEAKAAPAYEKDKN